MKILHIVEAFTGGVASYLQTLVNGLSEDCQSVLLYALRPETPKEPEKLFRPGTVLIHSEHLTREISPRADLAAFWEIRRVVREIRPDVVHLHSSKAGALGRWAVGGIPTFYTPHGYSFLMKDCGAAKARIYFLIEKLCGFRPCVTLACGQAEFEQGRRVSGRVVRIDNGIDTARLDRLLPGEGGMSAERGVCTMARIVPQKNPELFNRIARAFPDVKFVWIGDGELRDALDSPNIEVTGWLPRSRALARMMESSIFLLPSRWEGMSLSLLEAMYLRRACVVSGIPANAGAVRDGETGYTADSPEDYVRILGELLEKGPDPRMLDAAREFVARNFSQARMVRRYEEIYRSAVRERQAKLG